MPEFLVATFEDLSDGQMKEVALGKSKCLLSRVNGQYFATSHLCPHYKAPLVKGVIASDGRVMCPWHGACFRVQTGDVEDAPSVAGLASFTVTRRGDNIFVSASEDQLKAGKAPTPVCKNHSKKANEAPVVIVGGGAGGMIAAETLRKEGYSGKITMISRETYLPIDRPKLSKALKIDAAKIALRTQEEINSMKIDIKLDTQVVSVDTNLKSVVLSNGSTVDYSSLILATGADPRIPPLVGKDLENVLVIRGVNDITNLDARLSEIQGKPNVVIVGSSFIGMESASILAKNAKVTVIGMEKFPFERVLGPKVGEAMMKLNMQNGIVFKMEKLVDRFEPKDKSSKKVGSVVLKSGEKIPCDIVILGIGAIPQTSYLKGSPINLDKDGGISVESTMAIPGISNVYAVGDIARYPYHLTNENVRVEHWNVAQNQARIAAKNIIASKMGSNLHSFKQIPYFWTVQYGKSLRYVGHATSFDDTIVQGSLQLEPDGSGLSFVVYYLRKGEIVAVCSLAADPAVSHASELMRIGKMPSVADLRAGLDICSVPLISDETFIVPKKRSNLTDANNVLFIIVPVAVLSVAALITVYIHRSYYS